MPTAIPPLLGPYLKPSSEQKLDLVTSVLDATSTWLVLRFLYAAIYGTEGNDRPNSISNISIKPERKDAVILVSLLKPFNLWAEVGKKVGLHLHELALSEHFVFVDGISLASTGGLVADTPSVHLKSHTLEDLGNAMQHAVRQISNRRSQSPTAHDTARRITVIFDGLDFLLAAQPNVTPVMLAQTLMTIRGQLHGAVVTCSADAPLLHNSSSSATPLEKHHRTFVMAMAHHSRFVMQLRSLDTGAAKDVSGVLRISRGGCHEEHEACEGVEGEWLYQTKGDGTVRIWSRGE